MSKKYVPSFLKNQQNGSNESNTRIGNQFAALDEDFVPSNPIKPKPVTTVKPCTLAQLTGNNSKQSYATKFNTTLKQSDNQTKPVLNPVVNFNSEEDFPTLGGFSSNKKDSPKNSPKESQKKTNFADLAKGWAKQVEDDKNNEIIRQKQEEEEKRRRDLLNGTFIRSRLNKKRAVYEEEDYNDIYKDELDSDYSSVDEGNPDDLGSEGDSNRSDDPDYCDTDNYRRHKDDLY